MSKFEKRFGKYAIQNISLILVMCYAVGYVLSFTVPGVLDYLSLNPYLILRGQIWRLVTWVIIPPGSLDLFTILMLFFYYSIGTSLERAWGTYRYNVYLIGGMLITVIGSFLAMGIFFLMAGPVDSVTAAFVMSQCAKAFSTYFINMSIFLAYAATFPNAQVLLMFIIPVKVSWLGIAYGILLTLQLITGTGNPISNIFYRMAIGASLLNFVIFWLRSRNGFHMSPKQMKRRQEFRHEVKRNPKVTKHKCAICGRTDEDDPTLEFRFCSKCNGNYEYCQYHLFTHEHKK